MRGHGQESSPEEPGPEGVGHGEIGREVEPLELAGFSRLGEGTPPAPGNEIFEHHHGHDGPGRVKEHLDHVDPDHRADSAEESVDQGEDADDPDGHGIRPPCDESQRDGSGKEANRIGEEPRDLEHPRGDAPGGGSEAFVEQGVGRGDVTAGIPGKQHEADHDPASEVSQGELQEGEGAQVRDAGDRQEGERAGFGGHH